MNKRNISKYGQKDCFYIGERNTNRFLYKYMDLESAIISLTNGSIRFVEPYTWQDKFEGRFYRASYEKVPGENEMDMKGDLGPRNISVSWNVFLEDVKVSEDCSDTELTILSNVLKLQDIMIEPQRQYIYAAEEEPIKIDSNEEI